MFRLQRKDGDLLPPIRLESFRVAMRPPKMQDWPAWFEVRSGNYDFLKPFEPAWADDALTEGFFARQLKRQAENWREGRGNYFLIFNERNLIGGMNVNNIARGAAQHASLGYWIDQSRQGRGYMSEAMRLIIRYCFVDLKLRRIHGACLTHNARSRNLLIRAGFTEEGMAEKYLQIDGKWQDHVLYGLPYEAWLALEKFRQADRRPDQRNQDKA